KSKSYAVLFPFPAAGHFIPFIALAQLLHKHGYGTVFVATAVNVLNLKNSFPASSAAVEFAEIPFDAAEHGLPPEADNVDYLPYNHMVRFMDATLSFRTPLRKIISDLIRKFDGRKPLFIVSDFFFAWTAEVAGEFGIFHLIFSATGGFGMACYCSIWVNLPHKSTEKVEFPLPDFPEAGKIHVSQLTPAMFIGGDDDPMTNFHRRNVESAPNSDGLLLNTIESIDSLGIKYFQRKMEIPVYAIGPLLLSQEDRARTGRQSTISTEKCIQFLDEKPPNSVIYISFGSQNTIPAPQMMKLAKALQSTRRNFIWVVRPPLGFDLAAEFSPEEWLPEDFLEQTAAEERGLIVSKWAPQIEILAHESVGAFISHCGWNSVLETLKYGVPVIGWPIGADQFYNSKFLVDIAGVCVEVARGISFEIPAEEIEHKIELMMGEKGEPIRRRALEIKELFRESVNGRGGSSSSQIAAIENLFTSALSWNR
ncbi:hypothetical protein M569_13206, partial [Genlisea aurea]